METRDEAMAAATTNNSSSSSGGNSECSHPIVKGKRTKRQKLLHSLAPPAAAAAAAAAAASSTSSSGELSGSTTEEDEDMANCLILLAQGRALGTRPKSEPAPFQEDAGDEDGGGERSASRRFAEAATTTNGKASFYVYECKTCNKCFPSFQALGGHRSSHKKPKMAQVPAAATEEKRNVDEDTLQIISVASNPKVNLPAVNTTAIRAVTPPTMNGGINNSSSGINNKSVNKPRVHECSICGSEFSSGQALGGHMRRHRTAVSLEPHLQEAVKKEKNILSLDLNLPAPDVDDDRGDYPKSPSFPFAGAQPLLFSSSALVDCHY